MYIHLYNRYSWEWVYPNWIAIAVFLVRDFYFSACAGLWCVVRLSFVYTKSNGVKWNEMYTLCVCVCVLFCVFCAIALKSCFYFCFLDLIVFDQLVSPFDLVECNSTNNVLFFTTKTKHSSIKAFQWARYGISVIIRMAKWNQLVNIAHRHFVCVLFRDKKGEAVSVLVIMWSKE